MARNAAEKMKNESTEEKANTDVLKRRQWSLNKSIAKLPDS
jgi:hypothetical protein